MKKLYVLTVLSGVMMAGCVPTTYHKTVEVMKDADGKVTGTKITESVIQPNQSGYPVKFDYILGVNPNGN